MAVNLSTAGAANSLNAAPASGPSVATFTIASWILRPSTANYGTCGYFGTGGGGFYQSGIWHYPTGELNFDLMNSGVGTTAVSAAVSLGSANTWYHVAYTYDGATIRGYVNGAPLTLTGASATGWVAAPVTLFNIGQQGGGASDVLVQDQSFFNRALSQVELQRIMRSRNAARALSGCIAYYPFFNGATTRLVDFGPGGFNLTVTGTAVDATLSPPIGWGGASASPTVDVGGGGGSVNLAPTSASTTAATAALSAAIGSTSASSTAATAGLSAILPTATSASSTAATAGLSAVLPAATSASSTAAAATLNLDNFLAPTSASSTAASTALGAALGATAASSTSASAALGAELSATSATATSASAALTLTGSTLQLSAEAASSTAASAGLSLVLPASASDSRTAASGALTLAPATAGASSSAASAALDLSSGASALSSTSALTALGLVPGANAATGTAASAALTLQLSAIAATSTAGGATLTGPAPPDPPMSWGESENGYYRRFAMQSPRRKIR